MPFSDPQGVPTATYRLQLRLEFPFTEAGRLVPYLSELGISHCYGRFANRLVSFRRRLGTERIVVVVPRLTASLGCPPVGLVWENTAIDLPLAHRGWCNVLTRQEWRTGLVPVADLFNELPFALLCSDR